MNNISGENNKILNEIFLSREEKICSISKEEKQKIKELKKENYSYEKLMQFVDKTTDDKLVKEVIKSSLESYIDGINIVGAYENKKFYETGFIDGVNLMIECNKDY